MQLWVNWRTKTTHLTRDCHQIARVPDEAGWLRLQEGDVDELLDWPRRWCSWCVKRYIAAGERAGVVPDADLHPAAERADYITP